MQHQIAILVLFLVFAVAHASNFNIPAQNVSATVKNGLPSYLKCGVGQDYVILNKTSVTPFSTYQTFTDATDMMNRVIFMGCCAPGYTGCLIIGNAVLGGCCPSNLVCCRNNDQTFKGCLTLCPTDISNN